MEENKYITGEGIELKKISDEIWEIPKQDCMNVPVRVFANEKLLEIMRKDKTLWQAKNVGCLPGVLKAFVMPDGHQGYGFPIGGVAAMDAEKGGISPGGIGYDINCGVRLLASNLTREEVKPKLKELVDSIFKNVPAGLGEGHVKVSKEEFDKVLTKGARWAVENGYGNEEDLENCEEFGTMKTADPNMCSDKTKSRGRDQIGSLGSGNHFCEVQFVEKIHNEKAAEVFGLKEGQVVVMIHCGSRGFGHQVCSDYLRKMEQEFAKELAKLPDRELVYAPAGTKLCEDYFKAMSAAANFAWCNRHVIGHFVRKAFAEVFPNVEMHTVYDVAHNIAKLEEIEIDGEKRKVYMHRKGATRAFGPHRPEIPAKYQEVGQPVLIPGSMGTASYVLVGTEQGMKVSCGSTAHGAGRMMSRAQAKREYSGELLVKELKEVGIIVRGHSWSGLAEEAPGAYKPIENVAEVSDKLEIGNIVVRLVPLGCIKG